MSGWDFKAENESSSKKVNFTQFPVGVTRIRILDTAPYTRWVHWMPQFSKSINCPGRDCPIDAIRKRQKANKEKITYSMSKKIAINVYNYETKRVEIMEQGTTFFEEVRTLMQDLKEEGKSINDAIIKVRRRGTGKDDTSYRLDIDSEVPTEALSEFADELTVLKDYFKPHTVEQITALLNVKATTPQEYKDAMIKILTNKQEEPQEDEELGVVIDDEEVIELS